jgi:hypothetical protein
MGGANLNLEIPEQDDSNTPGYDIPIKTSSWMRRHMGMMSNAACFRGGGVWCIEYVDG